MSGDILSTTFKNLHFLRLDSKLIDEGIDTFEYRLKNHFNSIVAQIEGRFVSDENADIDRNYIELVAVPERNNSKRKSTRSLSNEGVPLFRIIIRKTQETDDEDIQFTVNNDNSKIDSIYVPMLQCELYSSTKQLLSYINVVKDIRSSTYYYNVLDGNDTGRRHSLFQINKNVKNENSFDFYNYTADFNNSEKNNIARINLGNVISLSMNPSLNPITKTRLLSVMLLMEVVEVRQKENKPPQSPRRSNVHNMI